jgi:FMN phosphatase YigB (HAD superfamily)
MSGGQIEFVYFDLGNILVWFDPEITCHNMARRFGVDRQRVRAVVYDSGLQDRFEHGEVTGEQFADLVRDALQMSADEMPTAALLDAISEMFTPIDPMGAIVREVQSKHSTGILSNTCHAHWDWISRQNWSVVNGGFVTEILSFRVGAMKPHPKIYEAAEAAAGVRPERILFLDDRAENVQGAIARGWQSAQCIGGEHASQVLRDWGVLS